MQGREQVGGILHSYKLAPATHLGQQVFPEMGGATVGRLLGFRAGWGRALCHSHVGGRVSLAHTVPSRHLEKSTGGEGT